MIKRKLSGQNHKGREKTRKAKEVGLIKEKGRGTQKGTKSERREGGGWERKTEDISN